MANVDMFAYVAANNPYFVKSLLHKYNYIVDAGQPLGKALQQLVAFEGEPAMMDIIENNPDKDVFMEYFEKKYGMKDGKCSSCQKSDSSSNLLGFMNFTGQIQAAQQVADNKRLTSETSLMVLAGAVLIAFAIISKKL
jgi:hypothetical protein